MTIELRTYSAPVAGVPITISGAVRSIGATSDAVPPFEARTSIVWMPSPVIALGGVANGPPSMLASTLTPAGAVMVSATTPVYQPFVLGPLRLAVTPPVGGGAVAPA